MGRDQSFENLLRDHGPMLRRIAGAFEADRERRRELEQEIFLSVWKAIPKYKGEAPIRAFIARVAHNRALTHVAKEASEPRRSPLDETAPSAEPSPLEAAQDRERRDQLDNAVRALPLALRQPTLLTLEGFTPAQIADILGMNANTVSIRLTRARAALRQRLNPQEQP